MLVPCGQCKRHVGVDAACPFCGGAPSAARHELIEGRFSRARVAALAAAGIAVALEATACPVYGGPPRRADNQPQTGHHRVPRSVSAKVAVDEFAAHATAFGCTIVEHRETSAAAQCKNVLIALDAGGEEPYSYVNCNDATDSQCAALFHDLMEATSDAATTQ